MPVFSPVFRAGFKLRASLLSAVALSSLSLPTCSDALAQSLRPALSPSAANDLRGTETASGLNQDDQSGLPDTDTAAPGNGAGNGPNAASYGQSTPKKPKLYTPKSPLYAPDPKVARPLPPLQPYATAPRVRTQNNSPLESDNPRPAPQPPPTVAVIPMIAAKSKPRRDERPFDPLGIDAGSLRLLPFVELGSGFDTNPNRLSSNVRSSPFVRASGGLDVNSQWSAHKLALVLRGGYSDFLTYHAADRPNVSSTLSSQIDMTRDTQFEIDGRFSLDTQQPGSQQIAIPNASYIVGHSVVETYGTALGVQQHFNRLAVRLRGTFDHFDYSNAAMSDGSEELLSLNDYSDYGLNGHVSYELKPGLVPYIDVTGDDRRYDSTIDSSGYQRTSQGIDGKAGSTFEISRILTGDIAGGYLHRVYEDSRLPRGRGPTIDGSIVWTPTPLTTATASAGTDFVETTSPGSSGALSHRFGLQVSHNLLRDLMITATGTYQINSYQGQPVTERLYLATLLAEYSLTREIVLRASYRHERFASTGSGLTADVFLLGVRLQR